MDRACPGLHRYHIESFYHFRPSMYGEVFLVEENLRKEIERAVSNRGWRYSAAAPTEGLERTVSLLHPFRIVGCCHHWALRCSVTSIRDLLYIELRSWKIQTERWRLTASEVIKILVRSAANLGV